MSKIFGWRVWLCIFISVGALMAQGNPNVNYVHDADGRLLGSVDANNNVTLYNYDADGKLTSVERFTSQATVDIFILSPNRGRAAIAGQAGTTVTIYGRGFSAVPSQNQVTFNGVATTVNASTATTLSVQVPAGARTGRVRVSNPGGTAESRMNFVVVNECVPPPSGIVSWWPGDGNARDVIGSNHGTLQGAVSFAPGQVRQAFRLNGGVVNVPHAASLSFERTDPLTLELWAFRTGTQDIMHLLGKRAGCSGDPNSSNYGLAFNNSDGEGLSGTGRDVSLNTWVHLALTFDGTEVRTYMNGQLVGTQSGQIGPPNTAAFLIGAMGDCARFFGLLDEVSLYNRALSADEIQAIVDAGSAGKCLPQ